MGSHMQRAFPLLAVVLACNLPPDDCNLGGREGILLSVVDSVSGQNLNADATVTVTQLTTPFSSATGSIATPPFPTDVATNRSGPYRVEVAVPGYVTWSSDVLVESTSDACAYVITEQVTARMVEVPGS